MTNEQRHAIKNIIDRHLDPTEGVRELSIENQKLKARLQDLLAAKDELDHGMTPEELAAEHAQFEEFKRARRHRAEVVLAWEEISTRLDDAQAYCQKHTGPDAFNKNVWHVILDDAIALRKQEYALRHLLWLSHGCPIETRYGDDGEMQCSDTRCRRLDYKRSPLRELLSSFIVRQAELRGQNETLEKNLLAARERASAEADRGNVLAESTRTLLQDARRYRRLRTLGCAPYSGLSLFDLDKFVDEDLRVCASRGEAE